MRRIRLQGSFSRGIATLMSGTILAQLIPVLISPILTRLYSPDDFGVLALFISVNTIAAAFATGKYELAISLPKTEEKAAGLVVLCIVFSLIVSAAAGLIIVAFDDLLLSIGGPSIQGGWLYLVPLSMLFVSAYQGLNYWHLREKLYVRISKNRVSQSVTNATVSVALGHLVNGGLGLVLGELIARIVVTVSHYFSYMKRTLSIKMKLRELIGLAKEYKNCPLYLVPATLLNISSKQLPIILFTYLVNPTFVGYMLLAQRVIQTPLGVISSAFSEVLLQRTAEEFNKNGNCIGIYKKVFWTLSLAAALPLIILYYIAPQLLIFVFGPKWAGIGDFIQILLPFYYIYFVSGTLNIVIISSGKQKINLLMQGIYLALSMGSILLGNWAFEDELMMLALYVSATSLYFLIALAFSYHISKGPSGANE